MEEERNHAQEQARAQLESIVEMMEEMREAIEAEEWQRMENAQERIMEDPLEVSFRGGWHGYGQESQDEDFLILLCTGGPAVRIVGGLDQYRQPESVSLEYQDWGTPWTEYPTNQRDREILLSYARQLIFE